MNQKTNNFLAALRLAHLAGPGLAPPGPKTSRRPADPFSLEECFSTNVEKGAYKTGITPAKQQEYLVQSVKGDLITAWKGTNK
jgi:hypothetical protein